MQRVMQSWRVCRSATPCMRLMHPVEVASLQMPCQEASARPQSEAENVINAVSSYDKDAGGEMRRSVRWEKQGQARKRAFTEMLGVKKCRGISRVIGRCCNVRRRDLFPRHPSQFSASSARRLTWLGQAGYDDAGGDGGCGGCCVSEHVAAAPVGDRGVPLPEGSPLACVPPRTKH